jgi:hypothetical protein
VRLVGTCPPNQGAWGERQRKEGVAGAPPIEGAWWWMCANGMLTGIEVCFQFQIIYSLHIGIRRRFWLWHDLQNITLTCFL